MEGILKEFSEILERKIKPFGRGGAHISGINPEHIGKKVKVLILTDERRDKIWKKKV